MEVSTGVCTDNSIRVLSENDRAIMMAALSFLVAEFNGACLAGKRKAARMYSPCRCHYLNNWYFNWLSTIA
jgi:hypothetical protein